MADDRCPAEPQKHGVSLGEIEAALMHNPIVAPDVDHSIDEQRFVAINRTASGRPIFVCFTLRERDGSDLIRPVSARFMHEKEALKYEKSSHTQN